MHVELRQQPRADEGADHADDEVADKSEAGALHDLPCEPAGNDSDHHYKEKTFARHMHVRMLQIDKCETVRNAIKIHCRGGTATTAFILAVPLSTLRCPKRPKIGTSSLSPGASVEARQASMP